MNFLLTAAFVAAFSVQNPMVHDPVMAYEDGTYYLFSTGRDIAQMTSTDLKTWNVDREGVLRGTLPPWATDSVPGLGHHLWAPDVIRYRNRWYLAYSCSTFGRNTSAIGLLSNSRLADATGWRDEGCIVASRGGRDNWNAIDPNFVVDADGNPWLAWGSFWDGIQLVRLDSTMHVAAGAKPATIARRFAMNTRDVPESEGGPKRYLPGHYERVAGQNAIEAPFIFRHGDYYYLFVSWDYCCLGMRSTYRVVVGRSRSVTGPYVDDRGVDMRDGGGVPVIEGDKVHYEAAGHCAAYTFGSRDIFICHGYRVPHGEAVLIMRDIVWRNGWPTLNTTTTDPTPALP